MSLPPGIPTKDLKDFYNKFIKETIKTKKQVVGLLNYLNSDEFIIDLEENLDTEIDVLREPSNLKLSKSQLPLLKKFYNEKIKLSAKEAGKKEIVMKVINYLLSDYPNDLNKLEGKKVSRISKEQLDFEIDRDISKDPKLTVLKPPPGVPSNIKEQLDLQKQEKPDGANELVEGLTNFYLAQKFRNKASFLVQKDIDNLRFEDVELVLNIDRKSGSAFVDENNQELIFNFLKMAPKDTVVIFLGIVDWNDIEKQDVRSSHSNLLIYRKSKKSLERFEPDSTPLELDKNIDEMIKEIFEENKIPVIRFISPSNLCIRFQGIEEAERQREFLQRKLPPKNIKSVSCFFWNVVYLQARLDDLNSSQEDVVSDLLEQIRKRNRSLGIFIKNYSITLVSFLKRFEDINPNNSIEGVMRRNINISMLRKNTDDSERLTELELKKKTVAQLKSIAREIGVEAARLRSKKKKQIITIILDKQVGFERPDEELDLDVDEEGFKTGVGKIISDVLEGKVDPFKDREKLQKQFDKMDKKEGEKTFLESVTRIQTRIDIAFINVIGLGNVEIGGKKLGNPKDHGQPPFTKTEKTVINIAKKLNPLGLLSETDFLVKALNFIKSFFGAARSAGRNRENSGTVRTMDAIHQKEDKLVLRIGDSGNDLTNQAMNRNGVGSPIDIVKSDLVNNKKILELFNNQSKQIQKQIVEDFKDLVLESTDFQSIQQTPRRMRKRLIKKAIGFVVFGV